MAKGRFIIFSLNSQGVVHDHSGSWVTDEEFTVKWSGRYEGKPASEEIRLTWQGNDEIRIYETETMQDKSDVNIEYVLKRKSLS
jgi:hypothetical protein